MAAQLIVLLLFAPFTGDSEGIELKIAWGCLPSGAGAFARLRNYFLFTTVTEICDGYSREWCTALCATTPVVSS